MNPDDANQGGGMGGGMPSDQGGGMPPTDPNTGGSGDQPMTPPAAPTEEEKCHCGKAVSAGNCTGCNMPTANCTCQPMGGDTGMGGQPAGGENPAGGAPAM